MNIGSFVKKFSLIDRLPVDVDLHVLPELKKLNIVDDVFFFSDPKLNPAILRGRIEHWEWPTDESQTKLIRVADITYAEQQPHEWQRLVCCKELLHILDPENRRVAKGEEIDRLIEKIIMPADMQDPFNDGPHVLTDRMAITHAVAVLFPLAARDILYQSFHDGKVTVAQLAAMAEIPERYVALVMNDAWTHIHSLLERL